MKIIKRDEHEYTLLGIVEDKVELLGEFIFDIDEDWVYFPRGEFSYEVEDLNRIIKYLKKFNN